MPYPKPAHRAEWLLPPNVLTFLLCTIVPATSLADDRVRPTVQLQGWATAYDQDEDPVSDPAGYGDPEHDIGFAIPRARVGLDVDLGFLTVSSLFGTSAPYDALRAPEHDIGLVSFDATLAGRLGPGMARMTGGFTRLPFSRELLMSSRDLVFQERAVASEWLGPARDVGVLLDYDLDVGLRGRLGVYNGNLDFLGDDNNGLLAAGRLEFGKGDSYRTFGKGVAYGVGINGFYNADIATNTLGAGADTLIRVRRFAFLGEFLMSYIMPGNTALDTPSVTDPTLRLGGTAQMSYSLDIGPGSTEFAARIGWLDDAAHLADNGDVAIVHVGATLRDYLPGTDIGLGFIHREELKGRTLQNDTIRLWAQFRFPFDDREFTGSESADAGLEKYIGSFQLSRSGTSDSVRQALTLVLKGSPIRGSISLVDPEGEQRVLDLQDARWDRELDRLTFRVVADDEEAWFELAPEGDLLCGAMYPPGRRGTPEQTYLCWQRL